MNKKEFIDKWNASEINPILWKSGAGGVGIIALGSLISALTYRGRLDQPYSPLNHFVSELGETGVAPMAWAFNGGLVFGGFLLVIFLFNLGRVIGGWSGLFFSLIGVVCGFSGLMVGFFPMNNLMPHIFWAMNFFNTGLFTMIAGSLILAFGKHSFARWLAVPGLFATAAFAAFLYMPQPNDELSGTEALQQVTVFLSTPRPPVWTLAVLEWLVIFAVLGWVLLIALYLRRYPPRLQINLGSVDGLKGA